MLHGSFHKGAKIRIVLRNGRQIITKFRQTDKHHTIITDDGEFRKRDLRSCNYYKPHPHEQK